MPGMWKNRSYNVLEWHTYEQNMCMYFVGLGIHLTVVSGLE